MMKRFYNLVFFLFVCGVLGVGNVSCAGVGPSWQTNSIAELINLAINGNEQAQSSLCRNATMNQIGLNHCEVEKIVEQAADKKQKWAWQLLRNLTDVNSDNCLKVMPYLSRLEGTSTCDVKNENIEEIKKNIEKQQAITRNSRFFAGGAAALAVFAFKRAWDRFKAWRRARELTKKKVLSREERKEVERFHGVGKRALLYGAGGLLSSALAVYFARNAY